MYYYSMKTTLYRLIACKDCGCCGNGLGEPILMALAQPIFTDFGRSCYFEYLQQLYFRYIPVKS